MHSVDKDALEQWIYAMVDKDALEQQIPALVDKDAFEFRVTDLCTSIQRCS